MLKQLFAISVASVMAINSMPVSAQSETASKLQTYFLSDVFRTEPPNCLMFYPEPIGRIPSHQLSENKELCTPPPVTIIPKYGKEYARLMRNGINAGVRGDYDSALINFRRAHLIEISQNYLGYRNREALRGINGATVAKRYRKDPHPSKRLTPQLFWYHWTGTGDRGKWGKVLPE